MGIAGSNQRERSPYAAGLLGVSRNTDQPVTPPSFLLGSSVSAQACGADPIPEHRPVHIPAGSPTSHQLPGYPGELVGKGNGNQLRRLPPHEISPPEVPVRGDPKTGSTSKREQSWLMNGDKPGSRSPVQSRAILEPVAKTWRGSVVGNQSLPARSAVRVQQRTGYKLFADRCILQSVIAGTIQAASISVTTDGFWSIAMIRSWR